MDAITRDTILALTRRIADLEAAVEVQRNMLKEVLQGQAVSAGTTFNAAAFDTQMTAAVFDQREKMALGLDAAVPTPAVQFVIDPATLA